MKNHEISPCLQAVPTSTTLPTEQRSGSAALLELQGIYSVLSDTLYIPSIFVWANSHLRMKQILL